MTAQRHLPIFALLGLGQALLIAAPVLAGQPKVSICHKSHTISVAAPASRAHLGHGDQLGDCGGFSTTVETTPVVTGTPTTVIYNYLFYPGPDVYFDASRELYFFQRDGQWLEQRVLPETLRAALGEFISLDRQAGSPASFHAEVLASYHGGADPTATPVWLQGDTEPSTYLYYPTVGAYYDPERALYFYRDGQQWLKAPTLSTELHQGLDQFVTLDMRTADPYQYHEAVSASYGGPTLEQAAAGLVGQALEQVLQQTGLDVFRYRYYPDNNVYYDEVRQVYFQQQGDQWVNTPTLPETLGSALGDFLSVTLDTPEPYQRHQTVLDAWQSGAVVIQKITGASVQQTTTSRIQVQTQTQARVKAKASTTRVKSKAKVKSKLKVKSKGKAKGKKK